MNTPGFRARAEQVLRQNITKNHLAGRKKGDAGYLPEDHADIADDLGLENQRHVDRILGAVRPGSTVKLIGRSNLIGPIKELLGIREVEISVPIERAETLMQIAELPEKEWTTFRDAISTVTPLRRG